LEEYYKMEIVKFLLDQNYGSYSYQDASSIKMCILAGFLTSDVYHPSSFIEWGLAEEWDEETNGNCTFLRKEDNNILLGDLYSEEEYPIELTLTKEQYKQILTDWQEKVLNLLPKEVIIKHENDQFIIKTTNL
jgi:hypothetical protein